MTDRTFAFRATWPDRASPARLVANRDGFSVRLALDAEEYDMDDAWAAAKLTRGCLVEVTIRAIGEDGTDRHREQNTSEHTP